MIYDAYSGSYLVRFCKTNKRYRIFVDEVEIQKVFYANTKIGIVCCYASNKEGDIIPNELSTGLISKTYEIRGEVKIVDTFTFQQVAHCYLCALKSYLNVLKLKTGMLCYMVKRAFKSTINTWVL